MRMRTALLVAGLVGLIAGCSEDSPSPTGPESDPALGVAAAAAPLTFKLVNTGGYHTCGVASDQRAYCWGLNTEGQLGVGHRQNRSRPTLVDRPLRFLQLDAGTHHTCGVTTDNLAYCWGESSEGQLGFGGFTRRVRPVPVAGGLRFRQVSLGQTHTCGVTTDNRAYCWGDNFHGQLGDGTTTRRATPVPVAGGLRFRRVDASGYTCGLTTADKVYCWGGNSPDIPPGERVVPSPIPGGLSFRSMSAGCGVTFDNRGYCWNGYSQPQQVSGFSFSQLVRSARTCGVTTAKRAYCWGDNFTGALGDGTETDRANPTAVLGGLLFSGVSPGLGHHVCGVTTVGRAWCWGHNAYGQLGVGNNTGPETCNFGLPCSRRPKAVAGPV
jgi:alpha-tubulin suppressor-like RCC1 family protein